MGSTSSPQDSKECPNCGAAALSGSGQKDADDVLPLECDNTNCAVDTFWGTAPDIE